MSTIAARPAPLVRRMLDADGNEVTYLSNGELCRVVGIASATLSNWARQGLVRFTDRLNGSRNYAVVDAARLKLLTADECAALGIQKTPADKLAMQRAWYHETQGDTARTADRRGEEWDDYDAELLVEWLRAGKSIEEIAVKLERTYAAVSDRIDYLRAEGELPRLDEDAAWRERTVALLTPNEVASLLDPVHSQVRRNGNREARMK